MPAVLRRGARQVSEGRYVLHIDGRAKFHNGAPVTAEDLAASINAMLHGRGQGSFLSAALEGFQEARASTGQQVELLTDAEIPMIDERLTLVRVLPQSALDPEPDIPDALHIGTGAYRVDSVNRLAAALEPSRSYPTGGPLDTRTRIELTATPDADQRVHQLLSGDVHVIEEPSPAGLRQIATRADLQSGWVRGMNMSWLLFNCSDPQLRDEQTRRALSMAIDRSAFARSTERPDPRFVPSATFLPSWHRDYVPFSQAPAYDPGSVSALLKRRAADGLEIELLISSAAWVQEQAETIVGQLAAVGVVAKPRIAHTADLFADEIPAGRFQMLLGSGDPGVFADDGEFLLRWYLTGRWARDYCHLPEQDVLGNEAVVRRLVRTTQTECRHDLIGELQARTQRQSAMTVLGHRSQPTAWSRRLQGFRPSATPGLDLRNTYLEGPQ